MSKAQILNIDPHSELKFIGPFTKPVTSYIKLQNPSDHRIYFKIKTTAPKKYCVRPNTGYVEPKTAIEVAVSLQPSDIDLNGKTRHKFMVQAYVNDETLDADTLWKDVPEDELMDSKLRCVFEMPETDGEGAPLSPSQATTLASAISSSSTYHDSSDKNEGYRFMKRNEETRGPIVTFQENELQKAANEVKQLREELSALRTDYLQLKENNLKLTQKIKDSPQNIGASVDGLSYSYSPSSKASNMDGSAMSGMFNSLGIDYPGDLWLCIIAILLAIIVFKLLV